MNLGIEVVTIFPPGQKDPNGDPIAGSATPVVIEGCQVFPEEMEEETFGARTTTGRFVALLPVERSAIDAQSRVQWRGETFAIHGKAMPWRFMDGELAACQVTLTEGQG